MNVFDFDKTIYNGNSIVQFYFWLLRRHPRLWPKFLKIFLWAAAYGLHLRSKKWYLEHCYSHILPSINTEQEAAEFWRTHGHKKIKPWYLKIKQPTDVISTASPEFFVSPIAKQLGVHLIGTQINPKTWCTLDKYNWGPHKVTYFHAKYGKAKIDHFYSDSRTDAPLAQIANQAFLVKGSKITPWPYPKKKNP